MTVVRRLIRAGLSVRRGHRQRLAGRFRSLLLMRDHQSERPLGQRASTMGVPDKNAPLRGPGVRRRPAPRVGGLELRNVDANYVFDRSHRFAGSQPNSGFGDYSRLSCGVGGTQLGRRPGSRQGCLRGRHQPSSRGFPRSEPNSGHGDHSRLSCSAADTQLGAGFCRGLQQAFCTRAMSKPSHLPRARRQISGETARREPLL
jgi:hypothetical protein